MERHAKEDNETAERERESSVRVTFCRFNSNTHPTHRDMEESETPSNAVSIRVLNTLISTLSIGFIFTTLMIVWRDLRPVVGDPM